MPCRLKSCQKPTKNFQFLKKFLCISFYKALFLVYIQPLLGGAIKILVEVLWGFKHDMDWKIALLQTLVSNIVLENFLEIMSLCLSRMDILVYFEALPIMASSASSFLPLKMAKGIGTRQDNVHSTVNSILNMVLNKLKDCQLQKSGNVSISDTLQTVQHIAGISS